MPIIDWTRTHQSQEAGTYFRSPSWVNRNQSLGLTPLTPGCVLAGRWSQEPEPGVDPRPSNVESCILTTRPNALPRYFRNQTIGMKKA